MKVSGYVVKTKTATFGPFLHANVAAAFVEKNVGSLVHPLLIVPLLDPDELNKAAEDLRDHRRKLNESFNRAHYWKLDL